jgi:hypothetical protein
MLLSFVTSASAGWNHWTGAVSDDWFTAGNWDHATSGNIVPLPFHMVDIGQSTPLGNPMPVIRSAGAVGEITCLPGWWPTPAGVSPSLTIETGGTYDAQNAYILVGRASGTPTVGVTSTLYMRGGSITGSGSHWQGTRWLIISGNGGKTAGGHGVLDMTSGTIDCQAMAVDHTDGDGVDDLGGEAYVSGGVITIGYDFFEPSFTIGVFGSMEVSGDAEINLLKYANGNQNWAAEDVEIVGNLNIASYTCSIKLPEFLPTVADVLDYMGDGVNPGNLTVMGNAATSSNLVIDLSDPGYTVISGIPEPGTLVLLGLGGLALFRKRRS